MSDFVRPACLPPPKTEIQNGALCTVVGWGQLFESGKIFREYRRRLLKWHCWKTAVTCELFWNFIWFFSTEGYISSIICMHAVFIVWKDSLAASPNENIGQTEVACQKPMQHVEYVSEISTDTVQWIYECLLSLVRLSVHTVQKLSVTLPPALQNPSFRV